MTTNKLSENDLDDNKTAADNNQAEMSIDEQINILAAVIIELLLNDLNKEL